MTLTVGDIMFRVFPNGDTVAFSEACPPVSGWASVPDFPPDLFAFTAYLLEVAGAYHYLMPGRRGAKSEELSGLSDILSPAEIENAAVRWRRLFVVPPRVKRLWQQLKSFRKAPVYFDGPLSQGRALALPDWWSIAVNLMLIADEACSDVGYGLTKQFSRKDKGTEDDSVSWISYITTIEAALLSESLLEKSNDHAGHHHAKLVPQGDTVCLKADPDVACVQPKSRTPGVGCTLRTFSHNLALLPPRGVVRTTWQRPPWPLRNEDHSALNLLLVPFPYSVAASSFSGERKSGAIPSLLGPQTGQPWGWFELEQSWLNGHRIVSHKAYKAERAIIDFTISLAKAAMKDVGDIHGIVFPEYALNWSIYEELVARISSSMPSIDFLVAGSSTNCSGEHLNVALSTAFWAASTKGGERAAISTSRAKHHRWRLDSTQINTYALASALDPRLNWWEKKILPRREIHVNVFRESSTFVTMICEDLARLDPCHSALRAVAPSLVFVLLMDGPQLPERWPARYATALADDPGSSVLTFTSFGLIDRVNRSRRFPECRNVALWKDDTGHSVPIPLEPGAHGVVLTLSGHRTTEKTIDGRPNLDGQAWRYHCHQPVAIERNSKTSAMLDLVCPI